MQNPRCLRPFAPHVRSLTTPNIPSDALRDEPPAEAMSRLDVDHNHERWRSIDALLRRDGRFTGPDFEPGDDVVRVLRDHVRVLVVGAGGLGCELLKGLALSGFTRLDVIDMDTIDVTNLNRQFLFRDEDVGASKAETAARRVRERVRGCSVTPHHGRIEDKEDDWYRQFDIIALGLDSLEARAYINAVCCGFLEYDEEGNVNPSTIKPLVDGGTEGFKGHARVIVPGMTPCFNCTLWLFPPQTAFPLCTLAETPRNAAHCIEYARLIQWPAERFGETFDPDVAEHMMWVYNKALKRAETFGILGVTYAHTQGVTKNIIPAIPSTNAIIAAACVIETLKMATMCAKGMNNYMMYVGTDGVYSHTVEYERDPSCVVCSPGIAHSMSVDATLEDFMASLVSAHQDSLGEPSVSFGGKNLYLRGVLESEFKENLTERMSSLMGNRTGGLIIVNDKKLKKSSMRVRLSLSE